MITNPKCVGSLFEAVARLRGAVGLPISTLITPTLIGVNHLQRLNNMGVDRVAVALDAATEPLFRRLRGVEAKGPHTFKRYLQGVKEAVEVMGAGRVGCHLIVGLGETEREMVQAIQLIHDMGAQSHLFSFFPEPNTPLKAQPQPPIGQYRRIQLARFLIEEGLSRVEGMGFDRAGRITSFGVDENVVEEAILSGTPFQTSGCPGCNRPYANERPSQPIRNYPFPPTGEDIAVILKQMGMRLRLSG